MSQKTSITVIIPAYNESQAIEKTIQNIQRIGKDCGWDFEIVVVDDGSSDETGLIASQNGVRVIHHPTNGGYGLSIQNGIEASTKELIALTDADGTYPVDMLPKLVEMVQVKGFDMAVGNRTGSEYKKGIWKYPARLMFKWLSEFVAGRRIPDINSGLRVMKKEKLLLHYKRTCLGFSFTTSITLIFFLSGYFVGYLPIPYTKRIGQSKVRHFRDTLRTAQIMISVISFYNPLKLYLLIIILNIFFSILIFILGAVLESFILFMLSVVLIGTTPIIVALGGLAEIIRQKNY